MNLEHVFHETAFLNGGALAMTGYFRKICLRWIPFAFALAVTTPSQAADADGVLDTSFGTAGVAITDFTGGAMDSISALVVQPDGKIVTAGRAGSADIYNLALARYNTDGSLDASFGDGGKVITLFPNAVRSGARAIVLQPDGKIVAAGWTYSPSNGSFALARYNSDGSLDAAFGSGGMVATSFGDADIAEAHAVAIQADSKIVAAGRVTRFRSGSASSFGVAFIRYNSDGSLDSSFGSGGVVNSPSPTGLATAFFVQPNGGIYVGGSDSELAGPNGRLLLNGKFLLARYNSDGALDSNFGLGGVATAVFQEQHGYIYSAVYAIAVQADGKILAAGVAGIYCDSTQFGLARFNTDGSVDSAFGAGGTVATRFNPSADDGANALAVQPDGKIIVAGASSPTGFDYDFALARYNIDGSLDQTFGAGGKVTANFLSEYATAVGLEPDGRIVAAGYSGKNPYISSSFAVARFTNTPVDVHLVLNPSSVRLGGSFTASASGPNIDNSTYLDVLFRGPASGLGQTALNWQRGLSGSHDVPAATTPGVWTITGLRPHQDQNDHTAGFIAASSALRVSALIVTDVKINPTSIKAGGAFTVVVTGFNLGNDTYFDVRFRSPGGKEQVTLNWQQGASASHTVATGADGGSWTITGIWAHQDADDHSSDFASVSATITVNP
jgi:uncharacterized delta-60 repeat protein